MTIEEVKTEYKNLMEIFGIKGRCWDMLYLNYSNYTFCPENRKDIIAQYLLLESFAERAKSVGFVYYYGIDRFLSQYKSAVYRCLTNLE